MPHISDLKTQAERLAYFQAHGATSQDYDDAETQFLDAQVGITLANVNDMWLAYLTSLGKTGALDDMLLQFWSAPPP